MHSYPQLALEVCFFQLKGSMGEPPWGKPKDVETHEDIRAWSEGLKAGGGGGCVFCVLSRVGLMGLSCWWVGMS